MNKRAVIEGHPVSCGCFACIHGGIRQRAIDSLDGLILMGSVLLKQIENNEREVNAILRERLKELNIKMDILLANRDQSYGKVNK